MAAITDESGQNFGKILPRRNSPRILSPTLSSFAVFGFLALLPRARFKNVISDSSDEDHFKLLDSLRRRFDVIIFERIERQFNCNSPSLIRRPNLIAEANRTLCM